MTGGPRCVPPFAGVVTAKSVSVTMLVSDGHGEGMDASRYGGKPALRRGGLSLMTYGNIHGCARRRAGPFLRVVGNWPKSASRW